MKLCNTDSTMMATSPSVRAQSASRCVTNTVIAWVTASVAAPGAKDALWVAQLCSSARARGRVDPHQSTSALGGGSMLQLREISTRAPDRLKAQGLKLGAAACHASAAVQLLFCCEGRIPAMGQKLPCMIIPYVS